MKVIFLDVDGVPIELKEKLKDYLTEEMLDLIKEFEEKYIE